jgi:hypothetical protein
LCLISEKETLSHCPTSTEARVFRERFRMPFPMYLMLLSWVRGWYCYDLETNPTGVKECDACGTRMAPIELKILGCLRILGRGTVLDGIEELSYIAKPTISLFFHLFCEKVVELLYDDWVVVPTSCEDISKCMGPYFAVGLDGAIGSCDVVHVHWERCPANMKNLFTGKEGFSTIAYQMICDHAGRVMSCTSGFYGACNDKTIIRFDSVVSDLRLGKLWAGVKYELLKRNGNVVERESPYIIVDGGYHKWKCTMSASKHNTDNDFKRWRARMESVRKDIEDVYGRIKGRFRAVKLPILFNHKSHVDNMVLTAVVFHNMLHQFDGLDE